VLADLATKTDLAAVRAIAVDGTSATVLLTDPDGNPLTPGLMYNDARASTEATALAAIASPASGAQGASCSLAKLMWLHTQHIDDDAAHLQHQADWIAGKLCGRFGYSDYNNALKLGYDAIELRWPAWIERLPIRPGLLPQVGAPGATLGRILPDIAARFGLNPETQIRHGTTDSIAAFLAAGASDAGQAVTSLGSTLVLKVLATQPVYSAEHGVYSHRLGELWLAGGASNSGGAVLQQYFSAQEMSELTPLLQPDRPTGLDYYPLPAIGERFPINNPELPSRIEPLPEDRRVFFQAFLEGIAAIEARGYRLLEKLGAPYPTEVFTSGGGARNPAWTTIRQHLLNVPVKNASSTDAAFGAALLARRR